VSCPISFADVELELTALEARLGIMQAHWHQSCRGDCWPPISIELERSQEILARLRQKLGVLSSEMANPVRQ
jgi:hypothetical protein